MMRPVIAFLLLVMSLPAVALGVQESLVVFEFEGLSVDATTTEAATQIFRAELEATNKFDVVTFGDMVEKLSAAGIEDHTCNAVGCAAEYGAKLEVEKAIVGTLTMLGDRVTTEVRLVDVATAAAVFSDRFAVTSLDDLDIALRKLAVAVADRKKIESELDRFTISEEETKDPRRRKGYVTSGFGFGFGFPLGDSYAKISNLKTLTWVTRYEARSLVLEGSLGASWGSGGEKDTVYDASMNAFTVVDEKQVLIMPIDIGLRYIFMRGSDVTPFVGGGLGMHFIASQDQGGITYTESDQALALHAAGGVYAFQSYDFRVAVELRYALTFTDVFAESEDISDQIAIGITITRKIEKKGRRGCGSGGCF